MALRLGVGDLGPEEPVDLGFAVADAAAVGVVFAYEAVPVGVDGGLFGAFGVELCGGVSCGVWEGGGMTYDEFLVGNRVDAG